MTSLPAAAVLLLLLAGGYRPAFGGAWRSPEAFNPNGAAFQVAQVAPPASARSGVGGKDGLSVRYAIVNTSNETLTRVGIEVAAFYPSGQAKGFHVFTIKARIAPGERLVGTYATAHYHIAAGDRLVMVPYSAAGATLRWVMGQEDFTAVIRSLESAQGEAAAARMVNLQEPSVGPPQNPYVPGDPGNGGSCLSTCQAASTHCEATCRCGVSSTSCTCNPDGSLTTSCSCFQCPPPK